MRLPALHCLTTAPPLAPFRESISFSRLQVLELIGAYPSTCSASTPRRASAPGLVSTNDRTTLCISFELERRGEHC